MEKLRILGDPDRPLRGRVRISGAKNAVLPEIVASLLTEERLTLGNIPLVKDVLTILTLMNELGAESELDGNSVSIRTRKIISPEASYELVRSMRASVLVLGPLLARYGKAYVALPGGCAIGSRPIDLHIAGMQKLGAVFTLEHGTIKAEASRLHGADIEFERKTVGGTENLLMAATLARGETILRNAPWSRRSALWRSSWSRGGRGSRDWAKRSCASGARTAWAGRSTTSSPTASRPAPFWSAGPSATAISPWRPPSRGTSPRSWGSSSSAGPGWKRPGRDHPIVGYPEIRPRTSHLLPIPGPHRQQARFMVLRPGLGHVHHPPRRSSTPLLSRQRLSLGANIEVQGRQGDRQGRARLRGRVMPPTCGLACWSCRSIAGVRRDQRPRAPRPGL